MPRSHSAANALRRQFCFEQECLQFECIALYAVSSIQKDQLSCISCFQQPLSIEVRSSVAQEVFSKAAVLTRRVFSSCLRFRPYEPCSWTAEIEVALVCSPIVDYNGVKPPDHSRFCPTSTTDVQCLVPSWHYGV